MIRKRGNDITGINRRGLAVTVPTAIREAVVQLPVDVFLDGEVVGDTFHAFDLLELKGSNLRQGSKVSVHQSCCLEHSLDIPTRNDKIIARSITITLGKSGRLVVPKAIRDSLGLREGSRLKLEIQGGKIEAEPESDPVNITLIHGFPVISGTPALARDDTVAAIKAGREGPQQRLLPESR